MGRKGNHAEYAHARIMQPRAWLTAWEQPNLSKLSLVETVLAFRRSTWV